MKDDGGGQDTSDPATYNILVTDHADQAPAGTDQQSTTNEDTSYFVKVSDFGFTDPDVPPNTFIAIKNVVFAGSGQLLLNNLPVQNGTTIQVSDIQVNALKFVPAHDKFGSAVATFTFQVQDNGGSSGGAQDTDQSPNVLTFNVTSVNDAPVGTPFAKTINEDGSQTLAPATSASPIRMTRRRWARARRTCSAP